MRFVAIIHVRPKPEVRDPQGEAILGALTSLGLAIDEVRTGKEIVVSFEADDAKAAGAAAKRMGDELLANPVIEDYFVDVRGGA